MTNYFAIDYGTSRIGTAFKTDDNPVVPSDILSNEGDRKAIALIKKITIAKEIDQIVLGLPLTMTGEVGSQAKLVQVFGTDLATATGLPVDYSDERLTSKMFPGDEDDSLAAMNILENYLNRKNK